MAKLRGLGILVTRPEPQAEPLCRLLRGEGARAWKFPGLEIVEDPQGRRLLAEASAVAPDWLIFVSANAVRFAQPLLRRWPTVATAAIGPATARALRHLGHPVRIVPDAGYDTDSLLADARLQSLAGKSVILVKGAGGRERLARELRRRGAELRELALYRRTVPAPAPKALAELSHLFAADALQVATMTSLDLVDNLLAALPPDLRAELAKLRMLVPSERIAAALRERSIGSELIVADSAEDHDLVVALANWWRRDRTHHP
jgi:uroporphyrinogen-III synthase